MTYAWTHATELKNKCPEEILPEKEQAAPKAKKPKKKDDDGDKTHEPKKSKKAKKKDDDGEKIDEPCTPHTGNFVLDEDGARKAAFEMLGTPNGIDVAVKEYMRKYWEDTWVTLNANDFGQIPVGEAHMLMRSLASKPPLHLSDCIKLDVDGPPLNEENSDLVGIRSMIAHY